MRTTAPFQPQDLAELDERIYGRALRVVPMCEIANGDTGPGVLGLRHDVDNSIGEAVSMAEWEADRGYRATYYIEHSAPYWHDKDTLRAALEVIAGCGHEIGLHVNALAEAIRTERDPLHILDEAVTELRDYGHPVTGVVAHGDPLCHQHEFVNDEIFWESVRPDYGDATRTVGGVKITPVSRSRFGFTYDPNWLSRADYLSDSGGVWSQPFGLVADRFPTLHGQLHMLVHPCWWSESFVPARLAA